ncbi:MAG: PLP-dependent transferase, partial [Planctomycetes bacterium]|nr:PLP-dependent transferase [Planctomycetota bacterium]
TGYGGMLSFELTGGAEAAKRLIDRVTLPIHAASLGGVESLIIIPAKSSHMGMEPKDRARVGITDGLVRFSTGIESADDLIEDLRQALRA